VEVAVPFSLNDKVPEFWRGDTDTAFRVGTCHEPHGSHGPHATLRLLIAEDCYGWLPSDAEYVRKRSPRNNEGSTGFRRY
jgi:hypothetical protein